MHKSVSIVAIAFTGCVASPPPAPLSPTTAAAAQAGPEHPRGVVAVSVALGDLEHSSSGGGVNFDSETDARLLRFQFEGGGTVGGGIMLEAGEADDDLDSNVFGGTERGAEAAFAEFYPHLTIRPTGGERFRIPIRIGPYVQAQHVEPNSVAGEYVYANVGGRVGVEPEVDVVLTDSVRCSLFGGVSFGLGVGLIEVDSTTDTEEFETTAASVGFDAGVRLTLSKFLVSLSYVYRKTTYDESDPEPLGGTAPGVFNNMVSETDFVFDGLMFTLGFRW